MADFESHRSTTQGQAESAEFAKDGKAGQVESHAENRMLLLTAKYLPGWSCLARKNACLTPTVEIVQGVAFDPHEGNEQGLTLSWELFREVLHLCLDPPTIGNEQRILRIPLKSL